MWPLEVLSLTLLGLASSGSCLPHHYTRALTPRGIITNNGDIADKYDFVIVGGGQAGLVLASRLTEDASTTVLVIEAGDSGDAIRSDLDTPAFAYYKSKLGSSYDYGYKTVAQSKLNNRAISWPRGKLLGGSSAINGMYLVRPSQVEVDAWSGLIAEDDSSAASAWSWSSLHEAMQKSEVFTPPSDEIKNLGGIRYDASKYGTSGPLHHSYPGHTFSQYADWHTTFENLGVPANGDAFSGNNWGVYIAQSTINPQNWTRSYSRSAYIDPLPPRSNLAILVNATVTRLVFADGSSGNLTATGVEFATDRDATKRTVSVGKEVILAGGAIGSPQVLMLSGIGPKDVLESAGVKVLSELPGVGQHLQDHLSTGVNFKTNVETAGGIFSEGSSLAKTPEFLSFVNSATAYVNLSTLLGGDDAAAAYRKTVADAMESSTSLVPSQNQEVLAGYKAISDVVANKLLPSSIGQAEFLLSMHAAGQIGVQAALQHPLSHGRLYINSASAFDAPTIDPNYLAHSADLTIMREGLKMARKIAQTAPLNKAVGDEISPGPSVQTDAEWDEWLVNQISTEFHCSSTCSMLPRNKGGVVNAKLQVYGTANVRVADSSIFPFTFSAHLMAPTYGVAEQAASIIRGFYNAAPPSNSNSSPSGSSSSSQPNQTNQPKNAAVSGHVASWTSWTLLSSFLLALLAL
ncbi:hypothetical protein HGRIS_008695 [Hohenbuehelia grisea]|uniref:Glucose-methanol-choline oxidoreductase N-terminal domain-containing protein n=1 Tax=Hohenbuehelia grisea TaxID=104357 RepID=A0ABR3J8Y9_9AGAR